MTYPLHFHIEKLTEGTLALKKKRLQKKRGDGRYLRKRAKSNITILKWDPGTKEYNREYMSIKIKSRTTESMDSTCESPKIP